ncbi:SusD/RagB family nutrient-binding outer membrane lipoprotein [uncultured Chitinophaga sp.]|uniref:SusD/RagB family nutrient-binding outer membrane lipoprotein n=1 Tax=uncultured Chitinophaga sp. TaxID=339340 RepID=UPI00262B3289|nr:SusD/RagB family nutrient-binding outer membrane lipoprotein [uncultured Chitinophaga sp.]
MSAKHRHLLRILLFAGLLPYACTRNFDAINTDPLRGKDIAPGQQLSAAAYYLNGGRETGYPNLFLFQPAVQYINGAEDMRAGSKYIRDDFANDRIWEIFYGKSIKQLTDLVERCRQDTALVNYVAAARILKAYIFSIITDTYGDVPYSEAGLAYYGKIYTPRYDRQQDIYQDLFDELAAAAAQFNPSQQALDNDIVYKGNIDQWKRLANSLRLRLGMRLTRIDAAMARKQVMAAIAGGVMHHHSDNFLVIHENAAYPDLRGNGYAQALQEAQTYLRTIGCSTFVNYLKREKDPRLGAFFVNRDEKGKDITAYTHYLPIPPGLYWWDERADYTASDGTIIPHNNKYCVISPPFYQLEAPFLHLSYAEVQFLLAEAAVRGWYNGNAQTLYRQGIRAAMQQLENYPGMQAISPQTIDSFVAAHPLLAENALEEINMQKWVAFFPNGYEAYANQRRSGWPVLAPITDIGGESETGGRIFRRLFYPSAEAYTNTRHYREAVDRMGGKDDWLQHVWWDP